jgi:hypothetical protein
MKRDLITSAPLDGTARSAFGLCGPRGGGATAVIVFGIVLATIAAASGAEGARMNVPASDVGARVQVIGAMGLPLGTVREVVIEVEDGAATKSKDDASFYLAKILRIDGKDIKDPVVLQFRSRATALQSSYEARRQQLGGEGRHLTSEIRDLNADYVGARFIITAYETGEFAGMPPGVPSALAWQDSKFRFRTYLVIITARRAKKEHGNDRVAPGSFPSGGGVGAGRR